MCREKDFDALASLEFVNWCGDLNAKHKPQLRCDIDDADTTTHFVEIENYKTYDRNIEMKGVLHKGRASFQPEDAIVKVAQEWEYNFRLLASDRERVKAATVCKVMNTYGTEWIDVEIKYDHQWTPNKMQPADTTNLRLKINVH
jgi:hypothetical protein